jgi:hypothetical protein
LFQYDWEFTEIEIPVSLYDENGNLTETIPSIIVQLKNAKILGHDNDLPDCHDRIEDYIKKKLVDYIASAKKSRGGFVEHVSLSEHIWISGGMGDRTLIIRTKATPYQIVEILQRPDTTLSPSSERKRLTTMGRRAHDVSRGYYPGRRTHARASFG